MIRALFAPLTPADELRQERERVARKRPHLALATAPEPQHRPPMRDVFAWVSLADVVPVEDDQ